MGREAPSTCVQDLVKEADVSTRAKHHELLQVQAVSFLFGFEWAITLDQFYATSMDSGGRAFYYAMQYGL